MASPPPPYARRILVLLPLTLFAIAGTLVAVLGVCFPTGPTDELAAWLPLYLPIMAIGPVLFAGVIFGYSWARLGLAATYWALLAIQLVVFLPHIAPFGRGTLLFVAVLATTAVALRLVHGDKMRAAVLEAEANRKRRSPNGLGLVVTATWTAVFGATMAVLLLLLDLRAGGGPDLIGHRSGFAFAVLIVLFFLAFRERVAPFWVNCVTLLVAGAHLPRVLAGSPIGGSSELGSFVYYAIVLSVVGLVAATRPAFREYWTRLPRHNLPPKGEKALVPSARHQKKKRHR